MYMYMHQKGVSNSQIKAQSDKDSGANATP